MWEKIQKLLDRVESRLALIAVLGGGSVLGVMTAWLSTTVEWINRFGWFGWWLSGLTGVLFGSLIAAAVAYVRLSWVNAASRKKWAERAHAINPLDAAFHHLRINWLDIADPTVNVVRGKTFTDCQLRGPANISFGGKGNNITNASFINCDVVVIAPGRRFLNTIELQDSSILSCEIWNTVIFIPQSMVQEFAAMGSGFVTLTGVSALDKK